MLQKRSILIFIILFILIFSLITEIITFYSEIKEEKQNFYENSKEVYNTIIDQQLKSIDSIALLLANDELIKEAYLNNNPKLIKKHILPYWENVKKSNLIYEIHFFKPPAISFVNFSNFSSIGNDVSDVRTDIKWVTSSFENSNHIMMCKTFAGIRGTFPIIYENKILGGLSLGKKIDWLPSTIKRLTSNDSFLVYTKESTNSLLDHYYNNFMEDKTTIGNYILADKTIDIPKSVIEKINFNKKIQDIEIDKNLYSLNIFPIYDFEKKLLAYVCTLNDLESFYQKFTLTTIQNIFLLLIAGFFVYIILNGKINEMLKEINIILNITNNIKNNRFDDFKAESNYSEITNDELINLESNVREMGKTIHKQFIEKDKIVLKQSKLAAMGEMIDNIAHQWRQPLSIIKTNASGIKVQKEFGLITEEQENKMLDSISDTSDYLSQTIEDFRNFFREDKKVKNFNLKNTFLKTKNLILTNLKNRDIQIDEEIDDVEIMGLENELIQVFMNLITNTLDAFGKNQENRYIGIKIYIDTEKNVVIEFIDNAGGINISIIDKVFNERFTTKESHGGTGIGLYLSKQIIENSFKGEIKVSNELFIHNNVQCRGAKFIILLPQI